MMTTTGASENKSPYFIACHSFRGGVGKTTLIYNLGALLAATGQRVLMIDLDIEAPGLTLIASEEALEEKRSIPPTGGVVALLTDYFASNAFPLEKSLKRLNRDDVYEWPLNEEFADPKLGGSLKLMLAGSTDLAVHGVNQTVLYKMADDLMTKDTEGRQLGRDLRELLTTSSQYDYVLLDCRSGPENYFAKMATFNLADVVLTLTGLSQQHIDGAARGIADLIERWQTQESVDENDWRLKRKLVIVLSPIPAGERETREIRTEVLEQKINKALDDLEIRPIFERVIHNDRVSLGGRHPQKLFTSTLMETSAMLLREQLIVAHPELKNSSLGLSYHQIHRHIRALCKDDQFYLTQEADKFWGKGDYDQLAKQVGKIKGLYLVNPDTSAGRDAFRATWTLWVSRLLGLSPSDLTKVQDLLAHLVEGSDQEAIEDQKVFWLEGRMLTFKNDPSAHSMWDIVRHTAEVNKDSDSLLRMQLENGMGEDRWGPQVFPGSLTGNEDTEILKEILSAQFKLEDKWGQSVTLQSLAELARRRNDFGAARTYLERALYIFDPNHPSTTVIHSLGLLHRLLGNYTKAREELEAVVAAKEKSSDEHGASIARHSLAELERLQGHEDKCLELCQNALETAQKLGQDRGIGVIKLSTALVWRNRGSWDSARRDMEEERSQAERAGDDQGKRMAWLYLKAIECQADPRRTFDLLQHAYDEVKESGTVDSHIRADLLLAEVYLSHPAMTEVERLSASATANANKFELRGLEADGNALTALALYAQGKKLEALVAAEKAMLFYTAQDVSTTLAQKIGGMISNE